MPNGTILLDTNLLVLLVVGLTSSQIIGRHKRLKAYSAFDFNLLEKLLSTATEVVVTPNTLTETSNLIRYIDDPDRTTVSRVFRALVER